MRAIAVCPLYNAPGRKDVTAVFRPEAERYLDVHGGELVVFDNRAPMGARADYVMARLFELGPCDALAFFCHGWPDGIQAGFRRASAARLATVAPLVVTLYACSTAYGLPLGAPGGDGGFADRLRDELCKARKTACRVDGHDTKGHATWNPRVRRFEGAGSPTGGQGGSWIVAPGTALWKRWAAALRTSRRFTFPFRATAEIHAELAERMVA